MDRTLLQRGQFCSALSASAIWQCLCVALVLWFFPVSSPRSPNFVAVPLLPIRKVSYAPTTLLPLFSGTLGAGNRLHPTFAVPRLPYGRVVSDVSTPAIGNPELGFAAPQTFSLDQPPTPVEIRIGDFGAPTVIPGSSRPGPGTDSGFLESGFGGSRGGQELMDREPVRIISKPTPAYTEDARNKKAEGDMVVDVIFTADRRIVILKILRTIGYGLDESGVEAVSQIVFRPARENGRAVDYRARVRVEFRLVSLADFDDGDSL